MQSASLKRCCGLILALCGIQPASPPAQWYGLPWGQVHLAGQTLRVVSASSERGRLVSLEKYRDLQDDEAVLHVYPNSARRCLLTRDIVRDLDAAYLSADNRVVATGNLVAAQQQVQCGAAPAQQVLTLARGRLAALGVKVGDTIPAVTPLSEQALAQLTARAAKNPTQNAARKPAPKTPAAQRITLTLGGKTIKPLLVPIAQTGGMDVAREQAQAPLAEGWLYVFELDVPAGQCRVPDSMQGLVVWDPLKYRQYTFARSGQLLGSTMREDGKLCAQGGTMRYALALPQSAAPLADTTRLELAHNLQTVIRQQFDARVLPPFSGTYRYQCGGETLDALLTVRSARADGSLNALLDVMAVNDKTRTMSKLKLELRGVKNPGGNYVFTPVNTLLAAPGYQVSSVSEFGARPLDHLRIAMQNLPCQPTAADFAYVGYGAEHWQASAHDTQQRLAASDVKFLENNYAITVSYKQGASRIESGRDNIPGFWGRILGDGKKTLQAWAYQCSDRTYTITIKPKKDIPYAGTERYPYTVPVSWRLVQHMDSSSHETKYAATYKLPVRTADSVSDEITFKCVAELHSNRSGEEKTSRLQAQVGENAITLHRAEMTRAIDSKAVYSAASKQWDALEKAIAAANATTRQVKEATDRRMEQDRAKMEQDRAIKETLKKAQEKAQACAREKAKNGGKSTWFFSNCD